MNAIAAVDRNWAIGKDGNLLVHLPGDLKYFREKTLGKTVVMGRKTFESLPGSKPLPSRVNIVISASPEFDADCTVVRTIPMLFEELDKYDSDDIYIIGGEKVYRELLPYCDKVYITKIDASFPADKFFVNLDECKYWETVSESEFREENGFRYKFTEYKRKKIKKEER